MIQLKQLERRPAGAGGPTPQYKLCAVSYWEKAGAGIARGFPRLHTGAGERKNQNPARKHLQTGKISHSLFFFFPSP